MCNKNWFRLRFKIWLCAGRQYQHFEASARCFFKVQVPKQNRQFFFGFAEGIHFLAEFLYLQAYRFWILLLYFCTILQYIQGGYKGGIIRWCVIGKQMKMSLSWCEKCMFRHEPVSVSCAEEGTVHPWRWECLVLKKGINFVCTWEQMSLYDQLWVFLPLVGSRVSMPEYDVTVRFTECLLHTISSGVRIMAVPHKARKS